MSGRLIILPKKSYTPWNAQNLERVMKDERLHYEKVQKEEEIKRKQSNVERIKVMKKRERRRLQEEGEPRPTSNSGIHLVKDENDIDRILNGDNNSASSYTSGTGTHISKLAAVDVTETSHEVGQQDLKHVNLFEAEERKMIQSKILGTSASKAVGISSTNQKQVGIMPVFLTRDSHVKNNASLSLSSSTPPESSYMRRPFYERDDCLKKNVDDKLKSRLDPMSQFQNHSNSNKDQTNNNHPENEHDELKDTKNKKNRKKIHEKKRDRKIDQEEHLDDSSQQSSSSSSKFERKRKKKSSRKHDKKKKRRKEQSRRRKINVAESYASKENRSRDTMMELLERKRQREQKEVKRENDIRNKNASSLL